MKFLFFFLFFIYSVYGFAQNSDLPTEGRFKLYLWYKHVGEETYKITRDNKDQLVDIAFKYVDRGTAVPMNCRLTLTDNFAPSSFTLQGKTGRFSVITDSLHVKGDKLSVSQRDTAYTSKLIANSFPHYSTSPASMYLLLIKYWEANGRPANINCLPDNIPIHISYAGKDTFYNSGKQIQMHRYRMEREKFMVRYIWLDAEGGFAGLSPGFLSIINEKYADLLKDFRSKTAVYTLKEFPVPSKQKDLIVRNARLVDMKTGKQTYPAIVIVKNGIISWAGPSSKAVLPKNIKVLDAKGMTLLPGLWDMHQHYNNPMLGPALIAMGITSVRDCANQHDFIATVKNSIDRSESIGPKIYRAGLIDGTGPATLGVVTADSPEEGIEKVRQYKKDGYDQIKVYGSIKPAVLKAICDEAKRLGLPVTGHVPAAMKASAAIDSGMRQLNHINNIMSGFEIDTAGYTVDFDKEVNKNFLRKLKDNRIVLDGTLVVLELIRRNLNDDIRDLYPSVSSWPQFMQSEIKTIGFPTDSVNKYRLPLRHKLYKEAMLRFFKEGIPIVAGTDLSGYPGHTLYRELKIYVDGGLTPLQAIQTATTIPASVMGSTAGTISTGNQADFILVDGDPLKSIEDIENIRWTIKGGQLFDAPAIRKSIGYKK